MKPNTNSKTSRPTNYSSPAPAHQGAPSVKYVHPIPANPPLGLVSGKRRTVANLLSAKGQTSSSPDVGGSGNNPVVQHHRPWMTTNNASAAALPPTAESVINIPNVPPRKTEGGNSHDLSLPLKLGWTRGTYINKYGANGIHGEVFYVTPGGTKCKTLSEVKKHLNKGMILKNFSFSSKLLIGDFYLPAAGKEVKLSAVQLSDWLSKEDKGKFLNHTGDEPVKKVEEKVKGETKAEKKEKERKKQHGIWIKAMEGVKKAKRRAKIVADRKAKRAARNGDDTGDERVRVSRKISSVSFFLFYGFFEFVSAFFRTKSKNRKTILGMVWMNLKTGQMNSRV